jgi:hypothetical protein
MGATKNGDSVSLRNLYDRSPIDKYDEAQPYSITGFVLVIISTHDPSLKVFNFKPIPCSLKLKSLLN